MTNKNKVHVAVQVYQGCLEDVELHAFAAPAQAKVHQWNEEGEGRVDATYLEREILYGEEDIAVLGLKPIWERSLRRNKITTTGHLSTLTRKQVYSFRNIGHKGIAEIEKALAARGLALAVGVRFPLTDEIEPRPTCQCKGEPEMLCVLDGATGRLWECQRCPRALYVSKLTPVQTWFRQDLI